MLASLHQNTRIPFSQPVKIVETTLQIEPITRSIILLCLIFSFALLYTLCTELSFIRPFQHQFNFDIQFFFISIDIHLAFFVPFFLLFLTEVPVFSAHKNAINCIPIISKKRHYLRLFSFYLHFGSTGFSLEFLSQDLIPMKT